MALLGRRPDLAGRLRIKPDPARKLRTDGWSVFWVSWVQRRVQREPHLLLHLADKDVCARVILPNKARGGLWTKLRSRSLAHLMSQVSRETEPAMATCPGMEPRLILKQRHWRTRRGPSFQDAYLDVDLRTPPGRPGLRGEETARVDGSGPAHRRQQGFESRTTGRCNIRVRSLPGDSHPGRSRPCGGGLDRLPSPDQVAPDSLNAQGRPTSGTPPTGSGGGVPRQSVARVGWGSKGSSPTPAPWVATP